MPLSKYEQERERNIAKNQALLESLGLKNATTETVPSKKAGKQKAKPIQSERAKKRSIAEVAAAPRRQSSRLRKDVIDPSESPSKRRKREEQQEALRRKQEQEDMEREELSRIARLPRHEPLALDVLGVDEQDETETADLLSTLTSLAKKSEETYVELSSLADEYFTEKHSDTALTELKEQFTNLRIVSRAKVTKDRIYSAIYHNDTTKDLIFFGDKHGQLGVWDACASPEEVEGEDGENTAAEEKEGGKIWRLQPHWPATSKSSISCLKLDPLNAHNIFTLSYDTTLRKLSFETGVSEEVYALDGVLPCSMEICGSGHEIWLSDASGMVSHIDIRATKKEVRSWQLSSVKIGSISINPARPHAILCGSNDRTMKIWDARRLAEAPLETIDSNATQIVSKVSEDSMASFLETSTGAESTKGEWRHNQSVSSAYWSPAGNQIVSTSYDNHIRLWTQKPTALDAFGAVKSMRPFKEIRHNCQTGKWLTILRAQWSPNPDVYPHFTIGNMNHSLDIYSGKGELITSLRDPTKITAVQAVTCTSPTVISRVASGNASGRCVLWAPSNSDE